MSKTKEKAMYTLHVGRRDPYRRTIDYGKKKAQMVFEPGTVYELNEAEVKGCQDLIENNFLVEADQDEKGRVRYINRPSDAGDSNKVIEGLEKKVETLAAENAELREKLKGDHGKKEGTHDKDASTSAK